MDTVCIIDSTRINARAIKFVFDSLSSSIIVVLDSFFPSSAEKLYSESEPRPYMYVGENQYYDVCIRFVPNNNINKTFEICFF